MSENRSGPPAKARYDAKFPVVSFRVTMEQAEKLDVLTKVSGKSHGGIMREALQLEIGKSDAIYRQGYRDGFHKAKEKYIVKVWCNVCGEPIVVIGDDMVLKVGDAVARIYNWYHRDCKPADFPDDECELFDKEERHASKRGTRKRIKAKQS